jgi:hypothetical protein
MPPKHQLPALYPFRFFVTEGGLIASGYDINEITGVQPVTSRRQRGCQTIARKARR